MTAPLRRRWQTWLPAVPVILTIIAIDGAQFLKTHIEARVATEQEQADVNEEARFLAGLLGESVTGRLRQVDALHALARVVSSAEAGGDKEAADNARTELRKLQEQSGGAIVQVGAIGLNGILEWSTLPLPKDPVNLADRPHFQAITAGHAESFISEPVLGRLSDQWSFEFSRADRDDRGNVRDVSVVSVSADAFTSIISSERLGARDRVAIIRTDGFVLSRDVMPFTLRIPMDSDAMQHMLAAPQGVFVGPSPLDGTDRIMAWERLSGADLIVTANLDGEARHADLIQRLDHDQRGAMTVSGLVAFVGLLFIAALRWRQRASAAEEDVATLRDSESLLRRVTEGLPELIWLIDRNGNAIYASPAARELLGVEPEMLLGNGYSQFIYPDDRSKDLTGEMLKRRTGVSAEAELRAVRSDGRVIWIQTMLRAIGDDRAGDGIALLASARNVTRRVEAEQQLRRATQEVDALLKGTRSVLHRSRLIDDTHLRTLFISESVESVLGYTPDEARQPRWFVDNLDPAFLPLYESNTARLRETAESTFTYRFRHKMGHWLWLSGTTRRVVDDKGDAYALGFVRDITREHDLDSQLAQASKLAVLGEMSTGMAHEMNQPLAAISMAAENALALMDEPASDVRALRQKLERIQRQAARAAELVDHMQVFGRRQEGAPGPISVLNAIKGAAEIAAVRLHKTDVRLEQRIEDNLPSVIGYTILLEQVLVNLIGNAIDAIDSQRPPLPEALRVVELTAGREGGWLTLSVTDHAGGIDEAVLPRVFEPFFTTKPVGSGVGLGLSISYGVVSDMGGTITAGNTGDGAQFRIMLPAMSG